MHVDFDGFGIRARDAFTPRRRSDRIRNWRRGSRRAELAK
jgi:hypothetical protein